MIHETEKMMNNSHLPVYTGTTFKVLPLIERRRRQKKKIIKISIIISVLTILIGVACFLLYSYVFSEIPPKNIDTIESFEIIEGELNKTKEDLKRIEGFIDKITDYTDEEDTTTETLKPNEIHSQNKFNSISCGISSVTPKISYGKIAKENQFPWIVALFYIDTSTSEKVLTHGCGGSLISEDLILTAAHCLVLEKNIEL